MLPNIPYRYRVLALLCSLTTLTYLDRICISIVGVRIKAEFSLNNEQFGWVLASFSLAYALFEIPSGVWGDRIGLKALFIRIILFWSFFTALIFSHRACVIDHYTFPVWNGRIRHLPQLHDCSFPLVSRSGNWPLLTWVGIGSQIVQLLHR